MLTNNLRLNYQIDISNKYSEMLLHEDHILDCLPLGTYILSNDEVIDQHLIYLEKNAMFFSFLIIHLTINYCNNNSCHVSLFKERWHEKYIS